MIGSVQDWLDTRTPRERGLLAVMAAAFLGVALWLGVARPVAAWKAAAAERRADAAADLVLTGRAAGDAGVAGDAESVAQETASAAGLAVTMEGGRFSVSGAATPALFGWLAALRTEHGVEVDELIVSKNADATLEARGRFRSEG